MMSKSNKKKTVPFFNYLAIAMIVITIVTLVLFKFINVLPGEYFIILTIFLGLIAIGLTGLLLAKGQKKKIVGTFLTLIYLVILIMGIVYELHTINFLKKLGFTNYKTENYSVIVLNDSNYNNILDLENKKIGSLEATEEGLKEAQNKVLAKAKVEFVSYKEINELKENLKEKTVEAVLIEDSYLAILNEEDEEFAKSYRVIFNFAIDIATQDITKEVDVEKDNFSVYISGIDTYGSINSVSRSDVNMVVSVNPKQHKILIISIPRDYYVDLAGKDGKDKLTHSGIYGIDTSVKTIENLLDIKINYYVKVNFSSLINVVDALGGVDVYSDYNFTSRDGYTYKKGYNTVKGQKALSFVRERKAFNEGDRIRIQNQAHMLEAIIDKAISPAIIVKYNNLLEALSNSFVTNMDSSSITKIIKKQLEDQASWQVENYSLNGKDASEYTYTSKNAKAYVMIPDENTIQEAKLKLKEVLN